MSTALNLTSFPSNLRACQIERAGPPSDTATPNMNRSAENGNVDGRLRKEPPVSFAVDRQKRLAACACDGQTQEEISRLIAARDFAAALAPCRRHPRRWCCARDMVWEYARG